jgi:uncharacterized iron-regulated membrane protein
MKEGFRQAMAWLHTWAGLIFGWLLFAIFLTGTLAYLKDETSHWMQPEIPARSVSAETSLALAQDYLQQQAPGASRWIIELPNAREPALSVRWQQTPAKPGERGQLTKKLLDPQTGREVQARDTQGGEFFYRFHFQLQMPYPWGRWLSTLAAMVMFVALISGIITHKKIFKDFFTFRPRKGQRSWLDGHNAVGVLVLPFHLMITYSSLVIFMTMVMPASILAAYNGDTKAFFSEVFPATNTLNAAGQPTPLPPLAPMLEKAREQWSGGQVGRVTVNNPGDANASVVLARGPSDRVVHDFGSAVTFNGVTGQLLDETQAQPVPMAIAGTFYGLHMGPFRRSGNALVVLHLRAGEHGDDRHRAGDLARQAATQTCQERGDAPRAAAGGGAEYCQYVGVGGRGGGVFLGQPFAADRDGRAWQLGGQQFLHPLGAEPAACHGPPGAHGVGRAVGAGRTAVWRRAAA